MIIAKLIPGRRHLALLVALLLSLSVGCQPPRAGLKIVVIPKGMTHEFWQSIHRGALRAASDFQKEGVEIEIIWDGPLREKDMMEQIEIVDRRVVATKVDGIVLAPQHSQIMSPVVKRAKGYGIPVVVIDSGLAQRDLIEKYVATDNYNGGWMAAEYLSHVLLAEGKTKPKLILIRYDVGSESTEQRERGFLDYFDPTKTNPKRPRPGSPPEVEWLSKEEYAGTTRDSASRKAKPVIQQYRDKVDAIFAPNESSASGVLDVLQSLGINRKAKGKDGVHLMAFDSSAPLLNAIEEGDVDGSIIQDPYYMGYLGVYMVVRAIQGYDVSQNRQQIDISTGEYLVTKENVRQQVTVEKYRAEAQAARALEFPKLNKPKKD